MHASRINDLRRFLSLPGRVPKNKNSLFQIRKATKGLLIRLSHWSGVFYLIGAICLGILARDIAKNSILDQWLTQHPPGQIIWESALQTQGFTKLSNLALAHRIIRSLPMDGDIRNAIWTDTSAEWIVLDLTRTGGGDESVWSRFDKSRLANSKVAIPQENDWTRFEDNWNGFRNILAPLETHKNTSKSKSLPRREVSDPRSIQY